MTSELSVRISDGVTDRHVTKHVSGLRYRKTAPGGHADASFRLDIRSDAFSDLGPADRVWIYNQWGRPVWCGYTNNPGTRTGRDGQGFAVTAVGGMGIAADESQQVVYVDAGTTNWRKGVNTATTSNFEQMTDTDELPALRVSFSNGQQSIDTDALSEALYFGLFGTGTGGARQQVGAVAIHSYGGRNDTGWRTEIVNDTQILPYDVLSTVPGDSTRYIGDHLTGDYYTVLRLRRMGLSTNVAADDVWNVFRPVVLGQRMNRHGTLIGYAANLAPANSVTAFSVVEDLLGRMLKQCDPATAVVEGGDSWAITQLAYTEAVRATQVLDDLTLYEPDMLWEFLESNAAGLHRFNWRRWPTTPRYLIPPSMVVEQPGGDVDLCNRIAVSWVDSLGTKQTIIRTSAVPALGSRVRDADPITLPAGQGSEVNAARIGDAVLAAKASAPKAARVVVDRPIVDLYTGGMARPCDIEPGYVARVVATGDDLRLTEMEHDGDSGNSTLQLGEPVLTIDQRIARLERTR